jgi:hypothetical protein
MSRSRELRRRSKGASCCAKYQDAYGSYTYTYSSPYFLLAIRSVMPRRGVSKSQYPGRYGKLGRKTVSLGGSLKKGSCKLKLRPMKGIGIGRLIGVGAGESEQ